MFYGILSPPLCTKFSDRKFACAQEGTFRRFEGTLPQNIFILKIGHINHITTKNMWFEQIYFVNWHMEGRLCSAHEIEQ